MNLQFHVWSLVLYISPSPQEHNPYRAINSWVAAQLLDVKHQTVRLTCQVAWCDYCVHLWCWRCQRKCHKSWCHWRDGVTPASLPSCLILLSVSLQPSSSSIMANRTHSLTLLMLPKQSLTLKYKTKAILAWKIQHYHLT